MKAAAVICSSHLCDGGKCISEWVNGSLVEPSVWYNEKKQTLIETWELWKWVNRRVRKSIKKLEKTLGVSSSLILRWRVTQWYSHSEWDLRPCLQSTWHKIESSPLPRLSCKLHSTFSLTSKRAAHVCMCLSVTLRARDTNKIEEDKQCRKDGGKWTFV